MNKDSRPIYPPQEGGEFEDYIGRAPMYDAPWEKVQEAEIKASKTKTKNHVKSSNDYKMEIGEEITFENLNEGDLKEDSHVDIDSIIRNMDMSDHNYRDNLW